jgi:hypothetical protein
MRPALNQQRAELRQVQLLAVEAMNRPAWLNNELHSVELHDVLL